MSKVLHEITAADFSLPLKRIFPLMGMHPFVEDEGSRVLAEEQLKRGVRDFEYS